MRVCNRCNLPREASLYGKNRGTCNFCRQEQSRLKYLRNREKRLAQCKAYNQKHREKIKAYQVEWWQTEKAKKACILSHQKYIAKNRDKVNARARLHYALKKGYVKRQPCEVCGKKAEAHHPDYARPLDVNWLCRAHHVEEHFSV
jgi:hypothetical protein